jgi:hypothetical protein
VDTPKLAMVAALLAVAGVLSLTLLRRGGEQTATGTVLSKTFRGASTYTQHPVGGDRGMRSPAEIPIAESYTFELRVDGVAQPVRASFNTVKSRQFEVGQRVRVRLVRRGLPPLWSRLLVTDMTPADSG